MTAKREVNFDSIESYLPTPEQEKAWAAERDLMIKNAFGPFIAPIIPSGS
jgi:hypothetical protein